MSNVRALLKAKRQEARINHPHASYNSAGQLKCSICGTTVKHASAWEGHLGSKAHRTNVLRQREEERLEREKSKMQISNAEDQDTGQEDHTAFSIKRKSPEEVVDEPAEKRRKVEHQAIPTGFFSDPSRAPVLLSDDSDEDGSSTEIAQPQLPKTEIDLEYERFQMELTKTTDPLDLFNRATILADPVAVPTDILGFPTINPDTKEDKSAESIGSKEEEVRRKRDQEEKELIMDRLLDEERAQEDADTRVLLLKNKIDTLRKKRQEARDKKSVSKTTG